MLLEMLLHFSIFPFHLPALIPFHGFSSLVSRSAPTTSSNSFPYSSIDLHIAVPSDWASSAQPGRMSSLIYKSALKSLECRALS